MENFAATLTGDERKKFRLYAYASTWFGCFSDVMIDSSAILILFFTILGSSNSMLMLMTSLVGVAHLVFMFPGAGIVNKLGPKKVVAISCYVGMCSFLLLAAAPFFGSEIAKYVAFLGCFIYCLTKALWPSAWYPILNSILMPSDRAGFFGFMRFTYLLITGTVFGILGVCMSKNTPEWVFQIVIAVVGVMIMGRYYFLEKIRLPEFAKGKLELAKGLKKTVRNSTLLGFSVYVCFLFFSFRP